MVGGDIVKGIFLGYIATACGISLAAAYKVLDYIMVGATVAAIAAAVLSGLGIAITTVLIKKVIAGIAKKTAASIMAGW